MSSLSVRICDLLKDGPLTASRVVEAMKGEERLFVTSALSTLKSKGCLRVVLCECCKTTRVYHFVRYPRPARRPTLGEQEQYSKNPLGTQDHLTNHWR